MQDEGTGGDGFVYTALSSAKRKQKKRKGRNGTVKADLTEQERLQRRIEIVESKKQWLSDETTRVGRSIREFLQEAFPTLVSSKGSLKDAKEDVDDASSIDSFHTADGPQSRTEILCLGLGSVKDSRPAQVQLAFLLLMADHIAQCEGSEVSMQAYDPIWETEDEELLRHYGITVMPNNEKGAYAISQEFPTLVYMPHCTQSLYESLLRTNWAPSQLAHLSLLCNDLSRYDDDGGRRSSADSCLVRFARRVVKVDVPMLPSPNNDALNDLALQRLVKLDADDTASSSLTKTMDRLSLTSTSSGANAEVDEFWRLPPPIRAGEHDSEVI